MCLLASGSRGNAIYISDGKSRILIDAGLSGVEIERRMQSRGLDPAQLDGIVPDEVEPGGKPLPGRARVERQDVLALQVEPQVAHARRGRWDGALGDHDLVHLGDQPGHAPQAVGG